MGGAGDGIFLNAGRWREEARQKIVFRNIGLGGDNDAAHRQVTQADEIRLKLMQF
ncbi:uncharacterized protein METZ01_LOCUS268069, partial [marine metagenome]